MGKTNDQDKTKEQLLKEMATMGRQIKRMLKAEKQSQNREKTLRKTEQEYRMLVEMANSIILRLDITGTIFFINEFALSFFGYTKEEILGKNVIGTIVPVVESSGRDLSDLIESIRQIPGHFLVNENENMRKDGNRVWVLWTNRAVFDTRGSVSEVLCIGSDITDRKNAESVLKRSQEELERKVQERTAELKKAHEELLFESVERKINEEALRENEIKYRSIVEGAIEGIFQTNADGRYTFANGALVRMLGYGSAEELISVGTNMEGQLVVNQERCDEFKKLLETNGYVIGFETQYYKKDRSKIWVSLNVRAVNDERGNFIFYEGTVLDITMQQILDGTTRALSMAIELRDPYTAGHQLRVTKLATAIAKEMNLSDDHLSAIRTAGILHDIGKIYV
ncbi:MAG: hypothetical protein C0407_12755, partial [Desulfobacca sp.]|nr:hypothetical protein [Desulfobacca sp.]